MRHMPHRAWRVRRVLGAQEPLPHTPARMSAASRGRGRAWGDGDAQRRQRPPAEPARPAAMRVYYDTCPTARGVCVGTRAHASRPRTPSHA